MGWQNEQKLACLLKSINMNTAVHLHTLSSLSTVEQMVRNLSSGTPHTANIPSRIRLSLTWKRRKLLNDWYKWLKKKTKKKPEMIMEKPWSESHQCLARWGFHEQSSDTQHLESWHHTVLLCQNPARHTIAIVATPRIFTSEGLSSQPLFCQHKSNRSDKWI